MSGFHVPWTFANTKFLWILLKIMWFLSLFCVRWPQWQAASTLAELLWRVKTRSPKRCSSRFTWLRIWRGIGCGKSVDNHGHHWALTNRGDGWFVQPSSTLLDVDELDERYNFETPRALLLFAFFGCKVVIFSKWMCSGSICMEKGGRSMCVCRWQWDQIRRRWRKYWNISKTRPCLRCLVLPSFARLQRWQHDLEGMSSILQDSDQLHCISHPWSILRHLLSPHLHLCASVCKSTYSMEREDFLSCCFHSSQSPTLLVNVFACFPHGFTSTWLPLL